MKVSARSFTLFLTSITLLLGGCSFTAAPSLEQAPGVWKQKNHDGLEALKKGDLPQAQSLLQEALAAARVIGPASLQAAAALNNLASVYEAEGKAADATATYQQAVVAFDQSPQARSTAVAVTLSNLGKLQASQGSYGEASASYRRALSIRDEHPESDRVELSDDLFALANIYQKEDRLTLAEPLYRRGLALDVKARGRTDPQTLDHLEAYAGLMRSMHRISDANKIEQLARSVRAETPAH